MLQSLFHDCPIPVNVWQVVVYSALAALPDITYLSVGHRPSLLRFHTSRLRLFGTERTPSYTIELITKGTT